MGKHKEKPPHDDILVPKIDLSFPVKPSRETEISWLKKNLENPRTPIDTKLYTIRELAKYGEMEYLRNVHSELTNQGDALKREVERMKDGRLKLYLDAHRPIYEAAGKREDWKELTVEKREEIVREMTVSNPGILSRLARYDEKIALIERKIKFVEKLKAEIDKVLPITKDSLF
ncbi:MAG: hypothetical protein ABID61_04685 [Candidatus Micrarchaeota archaeon]